MLIPWTLIGSNTNFPMTMQVNAQMNVRTKVRFGLRPIINRRSRLGAAGIGPSVPIGALDVTVSEHSFSPGQNPDFLLENLLFHK